ncbi:MAG TPA: hypothetical protein VFL94_01740 [Actinomycetales bacterium]|nr:hypothetical protein [Actinomycetales bacterium]
MDDVIDLRTRLIYASLEDDDLVRQLEEARSAAAQRDRSTAATTPGSRRSGTVAGQHRPTGTRPWVTPAQSRQDDDLMHADVTSSGPEEHVVDVRESQSPPVTVDLEAPTVSAFVVQQRSSEWAADDPSYYLG